MIRFYCACGKRLKVDDALAGRPVQCPDCGAAARAPQADPEVLSGPEALVAAIKGTAGPAEDDIPVAEVVAGPADDSPVAPAAAPEAAHLDALARAAAAAPAARPAARPLARKAAPAARGVKVAGTPGRPGAQGRRPPPGERHRHAALIGALAAIGVIAIVVIIVVIVGSRPEPVNKPPPPPPAAEPVVETSGPPRFTGHQPGEMFNAVPFADEKAEAEKNAAPGK